jgi:hypothetical protein
MEWNYGRFNLTNMRIISGSNKHKDVDAYFMLPVHVRAHFPKNQHNTKEHDFRLRKSRDKWQDIQSHKYTNVLCAWRNSKNAHHLIHSFCCSDSCYPFLVKLSFICQIFHFLFFSFNLLQYETNWSGIEKWRLKTVEFLRANLIYFLAIMRF